MLPPDQQKEQLKNLLVELEHESFKNEVLKELKEASRKKPTRIWEHPAFLLLLGFFLTTVVGTWLTLFWQGRDQQKQRQQLTHQRSVEKKYEVAEQINKAVADAYVATHVALNLLDADQLNLDKKAQSERETFWYAAIRNWISTSLVLQQRIAINFSDKKANDEFQKIIDDFENISVNVNEGGKLSKDLAARPIAERKKSDKLETLKAKRQETTMLADTIRERTTLLLKLLVGNIHVEEQSGTFGK